MTIDKYSKKKFKTLFQSKTVSLLFKTWIQSGEMKMWVNVSPTFKKNEQLYLDLVAKI